MVTFVVEWGDRDSSIKPLHVAPKRTCQDCLANLTSGTQSPACLKDKTPTSGNIMHSVSATPSVLKSPIQMVTILANISAGYNNFGPDEPFSLIEIIASPYWKGFEKVMRAEFQSLIENDTLEYRNAPSG